MTSEAGDTLPAFKGDTPDPSQGLPPVEMLLESTRLAITPIPDPVTPLPEFVVEEIGEIGNTPNPAQGLPSLRTLPELPFTQEDDGEIGNTPNPAQGLPSLRILPELPMYASHSTLLVDALRKQRLRKIALRRYSRNQLRAARTRERWANRRLWISIASTSLVLLVVFLSVGSTAGYVGYHFVHTTQVTFEHNVVTLPDLLPLDNLKMYDSKGVLIEQLTDNGIHTSVTFDQVAPIMVDATVATEDRNFWSNRGIDVVGIIRALLANLQSGRVVEGGSTITQQLIKNLIVGNQPTVVRKLEEIVLAPQLNNDYTKKDILTMYLNSIYYGNQAYGIDAAASVYFGLQDKPGHSAAAQLDIAQAAMLAGLPSNPTFFDPLAHPQTALKHFVTILDLLVAQRYISTADKYDAIQRNRGRTFSRLRLLYEIERHTLLILCCHNFKRCSILRS